MANTKIGAKKTRDTLIRLYGADYYKNIGKIGGKISRKNGRLEDDKADAIRDSFTPPSAKSTSGNDRS